MTQHSTEPSRSARRAPRRSRWPRAAGGARARSAAPPRRRAPTPSASYLTGIGDEQTADVHEPAVAAAAHEDRPLHRALRRRRPPRRRWPAPATWIAQAEAEPPAGAGRLLPLRAHADEAAERRQPTRRTSQKFVKDVPARPPVPVLGRGQPRQRHGLVLEPLGRRGRALLPGAEARLQGLHRDRARRARRRHDPRHAALHLGIQARDRAPAHRHAVDLGAAQLLRHQPPAKAGARAN